MAKKQITKEKQTTNKLKQKEVVKKPRIKKVSVEENITPVNEEKESGFLKLNLNPDGTFDISPIVPSNEEKETEENSVRTSNITSTTYDGYGLLPIVPVYEEKETIDGILNNILKKIESIESKIGNLSKINQTKLSEMPLSELNHLKEMLTRNITVNNYPGGDVELKVSSNNLIMRITAEVNNRITKYE